MSLSYAMWPGGDPTTTNLSSNTAKNDGFINANLGEVFKYNHPTYGAWLLRWVQAKDAVAYLAGHSVQWYDANKTQVTNDRSGGTGLSFGCAGVVLSVLTTAYFAPILIRGKYPTILTNGDDDIAAGDALIISSTDGLCDSGTSTPGLFLGHAVVADVDADNTVYGFVDVIDKSF